MSVALLSTLIILTNLKFQKSNNSQPLDQVPTYNKALVNILIITLLTGFPNLFPSHRDQDENSNSGGYEDQSCSVKRHVEGECACKHLSPPYEGERSVHGD